MTFLPNIPQPTDKLSASQGNLLANFTALNNIFSADHFTFNSAPISPILPGYHNIVHMPNQVAPATFPPATIANIGQVYTFNPNTVVANDSELYFLSGKGVNNQIPYCYSARITIAPAGTANVKNINGNIMGTLLVSAQAGAGRFGFFWFYQWAIARGFSNDLSTILPVTDNLTPIVTTTFTGGPVGSQQLTFTNVSPNAVTLVYSVFYTYANPTAA